MSASIEIAIKQLEHAMGLPLPAYQTPGSAGMDLAAAVELPLRVDPSAIVRIPTGLAIALPETHEAQIRPRSGPGCEARLDGAEQSWHDRCRLPRRDSGDSD